MEAGDLMHEFCTQVERQKAFLNFNYFNERIIFKKYLYEDKDDQNQNNLDDLKHGSSRCSLSLYSLDVQAAGFAGCGPDGLHLPHPPPTGLSGSEVGRHHALSLTL